MHMFIQPTDWNFPGGPNARRHHHQELFPTTPVPSEGGTSWHSVYCQVDDYWAGKTRAASWPPRPRVHIHMLCKHRILPVSTQLRCHELSTSTPRTDAPKALHHVRECVGIVFFKPVRRTGICDQYPQPQSSMKIHQTQLILLLNPTFGEGNDCWIQGLLHGLWLLPHGDTTSLNSAIPQHLKCSIGYPHQLLVRHWALIALHRLP